MIQDGKEERSLDCWKGAKRRYVREPRVLIEKEGIDWESG